MAKRIPPHIKEMYNAAPKQHRQTMLEMRNRILEIVPEAEEVISYGMPAFKVDGDIVAGLLDNRNHVGYYPFSGSVLHQYPEELAKFSKSKAALHVPIDKPLTKTLLKKLIRARLAG